jgi:hypothetical protein
MSHVREKTMEALSLAAGIILMIVAAIGMVLYVALAIAIPVCRMLDWFFDEETKERPIQPSRLSRVTRAVTRWLGELDRFRAGSGTR